MDRVFEIFEELKKVCNFSIVIYIIFIWGFCKVGMIEKVFILIDELKGKMEVFVIMYNIFMDGLCRVG